MAQRGLWNLAREKMLQDRGALPKEEGDVVENFLSSWLREDVEGKEERLRKVNKEAREEVSSTGEREGVKGEDDTVVVKRRSVHHVSG